MTLDPTTVTTTTIAVVLVLPSLLRRAEGFVRAVTELIKTCRR